MVTWEELFNSGRLVGRDLVSVQERGRQPLLRGPIVDTWLDESSWGSVTFYLQLAWVACRESEEDSWVWRTKKDSIFSVSIYPPDDAATFDPDGRLTGAASLLTRLGHGYGGRFTVMLESHNLDPSDVLTEYHIKTYIRHHLYPPDPWRDLNGVGLVWNIDPPGARSQDEVKVTAVAFVVPAKTLRAAKDWCRGECRRLALPVLEMRRTQLLPGH